MTVKMKEVFDRTEIVQWLKAIAWDNMFSGTAEHVVNPENLETLFGRWRSHAAKVTGLQLASVGVFSLYHGSHIHCLLVGSNRYGETLSNVSLKQQHELIRFWKNMTHSSARLSRVNNERVVEYLTKHISSNPTQRFLFVHNMKLLKKKFEEMK